MPIHTWHMPRKVVMACHSFRVHSTTLIVSRKESSVFEVRGFSALYTVANRSGIGSSAGQYDGGAQEQ